MQVLPRTGKWRVLKVFSVLHLKLSMWKMIFVCAISYNLKHTFLLYSPGNREGSVNTESETKQVETNPFMSSSVPSSFVSRRTIYDRQLPAS